MSIALTESLPDALPALAGEARFCRTFTHRKPGNMVRSSPLTLLSHWRRTIVQNWLADAQPSDVLATMLDNASERIGTPGG